MKFGIVYRRPMLRSRSVVIDSESLETAMTSVVPVDIEGIFVEHVVDFENEEIIPVAMTEYRTLIRVPDGDFGVETPTEYFESQAVEMKA
jgi:hypothetical protein